MWLAAICPLLLAGMVSVGATDGAIPGAVVRTTVSDSERDYELRGATLSANGATTELIIAARPKGRRSESGSLVWATVDESGRVLSQQNPLETLSPAAAADLSPGNPTAGTAFVFVRGRGLLLLPTVDGRVRLVRLGRSNEPAGVRAVDIGGRSPIIRRVLVTNKEHVVLVGSIGVQPVVTEIDTEGKTIAEYPPRVEGMTAVSAVFESDGSAIVIGEQGRFPNATVWVGRVSARGDVLTRTSFPGRPIDIARGSDGAYVVLIERSSAEGSEILMKALAPDLSERWTRSFMSRQRVTTSFRVAPVASGGFIVAGTKDRGLWISRVKSDGAEVWTETRTPLTSPELEIVSHVELAATQDIFVTAYTAFVVAGREQREVVRTIRFRAN